MQRGVPKLRASRPENWRTQGVNARDCLFRLNKRDDAPILRLLKFPHFTAETQALAWLTHFKIALIGRLPHNSPRTADPALNAAGTENK